MKSIESKQLEGDKGFQSFPNILWDWYSKKSAVAVSASNLKVWFKLLFCFSELTESFCVVPKPSCIDQPNPRWQSCLPMPSPGTMPGEISKMWEPQNSARLLCCSVAAGQAVLEPLCTSLLSKNSHWPVCSMLPVLMLPGNTCWRTWRSPGEPRE